ncbi:MAG: phospho-N-acetylmuramoyl-pentapeptide-transferase [Patescibacteria group bacterium]|jgi:phospho-N-acetylmuramoyl-pentapeptide-transferase
MSTVALFAILRMLLLAVLSFALAMAWTPLLTSLLYRYRVGKSVRSTGETPVYSKLHSHKQGTPTMGGVLVWVTASVITLLFWALAATVPERFGALNFLTRAETWLPLGVLIAAALVGFVDDVLNVWKLGATSGGLTVKHRLLLYAVIAAIGAWWFYFKLGWDTIHIPLVGDITIGWWYLLVFFVVIVATAFSVNEVDGLDGLAGGVLLIVLVAYSIISFAQDRYDLAAFIAVLSGALLAFLWFNIHPARFFMGDTGAMSLGVVVGVLAMLTNTALLLPLFGFILVIESGSVLVQVASKKFFGKKVFLSSPLHHHLEAIGWIEPKIVMRFWLITGVMTMLGLAFFLIDRVKL